MKLLTMTKNKGKYFTWQLWDVNQSILVLRQALIASFIMLLQLMVFHTLKV